MTSIDDPDEPLPYYDEPLNTEWFERWQAERAAAQAAKAADAPTGEPPDHAPGE